MIGGSILEGNPPKEAGAGRARADTAEGNVSTINIYDVGNTEKQTAFINLARSRARRFLHTGRDFDELVNVGMVGLARAIEGFKPGANNGLAAYAIPWIDGAIRRFCNKSYWTVPGERNERGKHLPITSRIEHFGNVAIGDGSYKPDVSINAEIASDGEHGDDEAGGGTFIDEVVDRSLEDIAGDRWWRIEQRLSERESRILLDKRRGMTNAEIGAEIGITAEGVRYALGVAVANLRRVQTGADLYGWFDSGEEKLLAWLGHDAKVFRREFDEYCRKGLGHLYRGRQQPRMSRSLIPHNKLYVEPSWTKHKRTGYCICLKCCPTKLGPSEFYVAHKARLSTFERTAAGWAPKKTNSKDPTWISAALGYSDGTEKDDDTGPQAWTGWSKWKRSPQPKWKTKARNLPGFTLPKEARPVLDWMVLRHVNYKGVPLEEPGRRIKAKRAKVKRRKAPALPPELHFLSPAGVREWKKAAKRAPLHHSGEWSLPYVADFEQHWRATVYVLEAEDGATRRTIMPPAIAWNNVTFALDPVVKMLIGDIVDDLTPEPRQRVRTKFDNPLPPDEGHFGQWISGREISTENFTIKRLERKKPWTRPTVSTLASLCYSSDVSLTPLSPPPVTTTAVRPLTSAKLLQRNSSATA